MERRSVAWVSSFEAVLRLKTIRQDEVGMAGHASVISAGDSYASMSLKRVVIRAAWSSVVATVLCLGAMAAHASETATSPISPTSPINPRIQYLMTKASELRDSLTNPAAGARLHLTGTVTYYDPFNGLMFLQDATGSVRIETDEPHAVHAGDTVVLDGVAALDRGVEVAKNPDIKVVGHGGLPEAAQYTYGELAAGRGDRRMVTVRGTVRAADVAHDLEGGASLLHLDLAMSDGEIQVYVHSESALHPESLLDAAVLVTGVASDRLDAKGLVTGVVLYAPEASSLQVIYRPDISAWQLPLTPIDGIFKSLRTVDISRRVHVRGAVTFYRKGESAVIESDGKSLAIETRTTSDIAIGDVVDVVGFANDFEFGASLEHASMVKTGETQRVVPTRVSFTEASNGQHSNDLISINGAVVSEFGDGDLHTVIIDVDGHPVSAHLVDSGSLPNFRLGSLVEITGICRVAPMGAQQGPSLNSIDVRNAGDINLLSSPPWGTVEHLLEVLGLVVIFWLAISVRQAFLRLKVANQSAWVNRSIIVARERSRILELISSNRSLDEVLTEICKATKELLPGADCSYELTIDKVSSKEVEQDGSATLPEQLFVVELLDAEHQVAGRITVLTSSCVATPSERDETRALLSELVVLAMRQSQLFRGLVHHSNHDPLTGLPNRRLSEERLASALKEAELNSGQLAVIYVDINRFKFVNDTYGHGTGDLYLRQIADRLKSQIRSMDMLARVGGDEFVVIAPFAEGIDRSYALTTRLQACFDEPFDLEVASIDGSASFGFARYPEHGKTIEDLTRHADQEMYLAKENEARASEAIHGVSIISTDELEVALLKGRFRLAYQPQFSATGQLTGLEALIRLDDPVLGMITPDAFISVAERHPVIVDIGAWVLRSSIEDAIRWELDKGDPVLIAVNVAVRQLEEPGYAKSVLACLKETGFPPERLEIELVERSLMFNGEHVAQQLKILRDAGVRIALDDFGTGQSCLSLLHKLPIDTIKLDRRFIHAMDNEPKVLPIIQAIVSMAHSLGKRVVAEAIEHVGPVPELMKMGKMDFQGYLLSRPIPADNVHTFVQTMRGGIVMPEAFGAKATANQKQLSSQSGPGVVIG